MGLRDRKKVDTRYRLMLEALRLLAERGYDDVTGEEIAAAADVSPRTFFRYCPTKAHLAFAWHEQRLALLDQALAERRPDETVIEVVRQFWDDFEDVRISPELFRVQQQLGDQRDSVRAVRSTVFEKVRVRVLAALLDEDPRREPL